MSILKIFFILAFPAFLFAKIEPESNLISEVLASVSKNYALPIHEALLLVADGEDIDKIQFKPLLGGGTKSKIYRIDIGNKKYVLRLLDEDQPVARRRSELNAHKIGTELQIAPKIIYTDPKLVVTVMEFIEGRTLTREDLKNAEIISKVMQALKKFHEYPNEGLLVKRTKVGAIQDLYDRYKKKGVVFPSCFDQLHGKLQDDFADLKSALGPSHGDFNPRNIMVSKEGHIYIIDWAQASIDHPFLDIAWLSIFLAANKEQVKSLLQEYFGREPTESEIKEVLFFKDVTTFLVATLWIGRQEERNQDKLDFILKGPLKNGSEYILEGVSVDDVLQEKGMGLTLYSLGWLKEFIDHRRK
jgi:thiamine kinase-like enzyme